MMDPGPRPMVYADEVRLREHLERNVGFEPISPRMMSDALILHCAKPENQIDSAQEWLNRQVWDGTPRVCEFCHRYFKSADTPYTRAVSLYIWTALAGRILEPGCQVDMAPVLVGRQGIGKTSAIKALAPIVDTYVEINLGRKDDDLSRLVKGRLVGEIAELRGLASKDAESIKAWLSRTHEEWIPKYQEYKTKYPRRIVFFGTTNAEGFLDDITGERRWLPLTVVEQIDVPAIQRDRDSLWAEGAVLWRQGGGIQFQEAERLARAEHGRYKIVDVWEPEIAKWLDGTEFGDRLDGTGPARRTRPHTSAQILAGALGIKTGQASKREEMRVAACMRRLGFDRQRLMVDGVQAWMWVVE